MSKWRKKSQNDKSWTVWVYSGSLGSRGMKERSPSQPISSAGKLEITPRTRTHKRACTQCSYALLNALWPFLSLPLCKYIWLSTALIFLLSVTQVINITGYRMGLGFNNNNNNKGANLYYAFLNPFERVALGRVSFTVHTQYLRFNLTISMWEKIKVFQFEAAY